MVKVTTHVTYAMMRMVLYQISLLDHILKAHWKELHLGSEMDMQKLMDMLSSSQLEVLSKFKNIYKPYSFSHSCIFHISTLSYMCFMYNHSCSLGLFDETLNF